MSKRKEHKIKILKSKAIWPRILGMIITDIIILGCTAFISYLAVLGIVNTLIIENNRYCEKIVEVIEKNWKGTTTTELAKQITDLQDHYDSIDDVYILDSDFNVLASFGNNSYGFNTLIEKPKKINKFLSNNEIYRDVLVPSSEADIDLIDLESVDSLKAYSKDFSKSLSISNFASDLKYIHFSDEAFFAFNQWVIYKTHISDISVCINNIYRINNFHRFFGGFLVIVFLIVFLLCIIYEVIRIISYIAGATKFDLAISTDMVTGGKNKDWFTEKSQRRIKNTKKSFAIVQIRMEKYRNYCTSYGVKQGENLLEQFSNTLEKILDKKELSAHIEKADFALLLNYSSVEQLNERIRYIINNLVSTRKNQHLNFVSSVAKVSSKNDDINSLLSSASLALGNASIESSDEPVWFNDSMKEEQVWERRIEDDMEGALINHEFKLYLQPKYSTKGEKLSAAEALVRWIHPVLGFISPGKFIPIFENNGFILKLDDYMLTEVAKQQAAWMNQGKSLVPISVNVSRAHFTRDDLAEHICQIVDKYKVPHKYIELELTESAFFDDKNVLLNTVKKLKSFGFAISMDDFGAGYSSLNSLKELPLDIIKLDAEFFRSIDDINRANLIVGDTISLAKKLGMSIVAEGIETREQVDFLAEQDCDLIQGFYFAKPLPVSEFEERAYPENN